MFVNLFNTVKLDSDVFPVSSRMAMVLPLKAVHRIRHVLLLASCAAIALLLSSGGNSASAQDELIAYKMIDQWPQRETAAAGLFQNPVDLDVADDGTVFVADRGIGGVQRLLPSGTFTTPLGTEGGFPQQLSQVGAISVGPELVEGQGQRLYVLDTGLDRVVVYDLLGQFLDEWPDIAAESIAAASDGRVYLLDREASTVRAMDGASGSDLFSFGSRGTEDGQFANFEDLDVTADASVVVVSDLRGVRVQLFDVADDEAIAGGAEPAGLREIYSLTESKFNKEDMVCRAPRVNALGEDRVFVGQGTQACIIDGRDVSAAIATSANSGTVCRETVRLPRLKTEGSQFFALATYDPNLGKCGEKRADLDTTTVVARYNDDSLRGVRTVWEAAESDSVDARLFAPQELMMPSADVVFVRDNSPELRFYGTDGTELASMARDTSARDLGTEFEVTRLRSVSGAEVLGEIYAHYFKVRRGNNQFEVEEGIGRFKTAEKRTQTGTESVIEPVWTEPMARGGTTTYAVKQLIYNPVSDEVLVLRADTIAQQRTTEVVIARYAPDGRQLNEPWDLPGDGDLDPYVDMGVGPDGRVVVFDTLAGLARVYGADGSAQMEVPVARDTRAIALGPPEGAGSVFSLREHGTIERYADDGTITARLDGRALPFSDPTFITDLVVDALGHVYVADGQASLISVFEATDDRYVLPVPDDGECNFVGQKSAAPQQVNIGDPVTVELQIEGSCGVREDPTDIIVVVPYMGRLVRGRDFSAQVIANMLSLAGRVNFEQHRVGIVSYYQTYTVELEPTHDRDAYIDAVQNITRLDAPNDDIKARLRDAMEEAQKLFDPSAERRQVMVLLSADYCDPNNQRRPRDCTGYPSADEVAKEIRDAGTRIIVVFGSSAANLASSDEDVTNDFGTAHRRMVDYRLPDVLAQRLDLVDILPDNMQIEEASIDEGGVWNEPSVTWNKSDLGFGGVQVAFDIRPQEAGIWPTNVEAYAEIVDGWGQQHRIDFPVPEIEVIGPTATPVPPSETPTPGPSATPFVPTATSIPSTVYLPWLGYAHCWPKTAALDIAFVLDTSSSMQGDKLDAALAAVGHFLDASRLEAGTDRAALVTFDGAAKRAKGLTSSRAELDAALLAIVSGQGTRMDLGLIEALAALSEDDRGAHSVILLLSDGRQDEAQEDVIAAGEAAREAGHEVFAIGLGDDVDKALLLQVASDEAHYLDAPNASDLSAIYAQIAQSLTGCP